MNQPLPKEEYQKRVKEFLGSHSKRLEAKEELAKLRKKRIYKYANIINCENSTGDFLLNCRNCTDSFDVNDSQDCKYLVVGVDTKDLMDCSNMYLKPELCYQVLGTIGVYNCIFSLYVFHTQNAMYSQFCYNSSNLFGCCGLRNKKYCILNKQYTQEQYENMVPRIIEHMKKNTSPRGEASSFAGAELYKKKLRAGERGSGFASPSDAELINQEWGKYFPAALSPFGYNETVAYEYFPLAREEALQKGFHWHEKDIREYKAQNYVIPDNIGDVKDDILNIVLACEECGKNYKIIAQELRRLRTIPMAIPHKCPDCRHRERMSLRNERKLFPRQCAKCGKQVKSTFTAGRPEIIYCEECYTREIY